MSGTLARRAARLEDERLRASLARLRAAWADALTANPADWPATVEEQRARARAEYATAEALVWALPPEEQERERRCEAALEVLIADACPGLSAARRAATVLATNPTLPAYVVLDALADLFVDMARSVAADEAEGA